MIIARVTRRCSMAAKKDSPKWPPNCSVPAASRLAEIYEFAEVHADDLIPEEQQAGEVRAAKLCSNWTGRASPSLVKDPLPNWVQY